MVQFEPGAPVTLEHVKPWKSTLRMTGVVESWSDGLLTIHRRFSSRGRYDTLGERICPGATVTSRCRRRLTSAARTSPTTAARELFNIQTPTSTRTRCATRTSKWTSRYLDGRVAVVDEEDLAGGPRRGHPQALADTAHALATAWPRHCGGGDWRTVRADSCQRGDASAAPAGLHHSASSTRQPSTSTLDSPNARPGSWRWPCDAIGSTIASSP
jgi:hypothetical protein